jgi:hypothetical protein
MTFLGFGIAAAVFIAFILFGLRLFPLYNEKLKVMTAMKSVVNQPNAANFTQSEMQMSFYKNADINGSTIFGTEKAVKQYVKLERGEKGGPQLIHIAFEMRNKLFDDIELVLVFDDSMPMSSEGGGGD